MKLERLARTPAIQLTAALLVTVLGCAKAGAPDDARLSTLTSSELGELCDEIQDEWPSSEDSMTCSDGSIATFIRPERSSCGVADLTQCPATAGDLRDCTRALLGDPCSAALQRPLACEPLQQAGCVADSVSGPLASTCPSAAAADLAALEGVYELVNHTDNAAACDVEGQSVLADDNQRLFVLVAAELFGAPMGVLESCSDLADCRGKIEYIREQSENPSIEVADPNASAPELRHVLACKAENPGGVLSQQISVGSAALGACAVSVTDTSVTRGTDGSVRLESRTFGWQKPAAGDSCDYVAGERPAEAACEAFEVHEARFVSAL